MIVYVLSHMHNHDVDLLSVHTTLEGAQAAVPEDIQAWARERGYAWEFSTFGNYWEGPDDYFIETRELQGFDDDMPARVLPTTESLTRADPGVTGWTGEADEAMP